MGAAGVRPGRRCAARWQGGLRGGATDRALQWPGDAGPGQPPGGAAAAGGRRRPLRGAGHAVCHCPRWPVAAGGAGTGGGVVRWPGCWAAGVAVRPGGIARGLRCAVRTA
ncbi:hypothetical protein G6F23_014437 [Rhizopus arrhizus]|nr:hypothetical protein G6F23_014437 [Rhizopus arrhizus]